MHLIRCREYMVVCMSEQSVSLMHKDLSQRNDLKGMTSRLKRSIRLGRALQQIENRSELLDRTSTRTPHDKGMNADMKRKRVCWKDGRRSVRR